MDWTRILAYITGSVDQELLLRNEYLPAENRILRAQLNGCLRLSDAERATLGEIGFRLGRKALSEAPMFDAARHHRTSITPGRDCTARSPRTTRSKSPPRGQSRASARNKHGTSTAGSACRTRVSLTAH